MNQREYNQAERAAYRAIDAARLLEDLGFGSADTEHALSCLHSVLRKIQENDPKRNKYL